jgi:succinylglutamic semialdehyde dehydrogenase
MQAGVFIHGAWRSGRGESLRKLCPATGVVSWEGNSASAEDVADAVADARRASTDWSRAPQGERTRIIEAYADAIGRRAEVIAETISRNMGKAIWDSRGEAQTMKAKIALSIAAQVERAGSKFETAAFGSAHLTHRPHGVMAVYGPFNFPGHLPNGHIVPALLAGNTCVFKPSEQAPGVAALMADAFVEAGLPPGCFNIVHGARETGGALLSADINGLLFTGSEKTGRFFHQYFAGRPEVILALEMGGNNPLIIWDPADIDAAADIAAQSAYLTTGQRCSCARRIILPEGEFGDAVVAQMAARASALRIGPWTDDSVFMGPLVSEMAADQAALFQAELISRGGKPIKALEKTDAGLGFVTAGIIDVTQARKLPDEELFGPLAQIFRVPTFEAAITVANATRFGLSAGIVCDDDARWITAHRELRAGILNRNRPTVGASGAMPFGGPGLSGNFRPGAFYAADYAAWPQSSQVADKAVRIGATGFPQ